MILLLPNLTGLGFPPSSHIEGKKKKAHNIYTQFVFSPNLA